MHLAVNCLFKYLPRIVLATIFGFSALAGQSLCVDLFQNGTPSSSSASTQPTPGSGIQLKNDIPFFHPTGTVSHILQGDITRDGKLDGGMHTVDGFFRLFEMNKNLQVDVSKPEIPAELKELVGIAQQIYPRELQANLELADIQMHDNGVILVGLPDRVLSRRLHEANITTGLKFPGKLYLKSLFPLTWSNDFIISTSKKMASEADNHERFIRKSMRRVVQGVNVVVRFDDFGNILSAYPAFEQPKRPNAPFAEHQKAAIEKYYLHPLIEKIETTKSFWLIGNDQALQEAARLGFHRSPMVISILEQNLGSIVFRERLFVERKNLTQNQFKQMARTFLIHFGVTAATDEEIENVSQILQNRTVLFSKSLESKLNEAARKSLELYYRPPEDGLSTAEAFAKDAETNWFSIFFTDIRRR